MLKFASFLVLVCGVIGLSFAAGETRYSGGSLQINDGAWKNAESIANSGTCTLAGMVVYDSVNHWLEWCNGSYLRKADAGANLGACSVEGQTKYASSKLQFCNGSQWRSAGPYTAPAAAPCTKPWGGTMASGTSISAYFVSSSSCCLDSKETRTCSNGVLSGSATKQNCSYSGSGGCF